ncbi:MAG: hypothetical protein H7A39_06260 [Chlamydiales bacterium]|nr:hypothetical protein [Chlamydiales bacterium]
MKEKVRNFCLAISLFLIPIVGFADEPVKPNCQHKPPILTTTAISFQSFAEKIREMKKPRNSMTLYKLPKLFAWDLMDVAGMLKNLDFPLMLMKKLNE